MKQKKHAIANLVATAIMVLLGDYDLPLQEIEIRSTRDLPKGRKTRDGKIAEEPWKGYIVKFKRSNVVVPIDAGLILAAKAEAFVTEDVDGDTLFTPVFTKLGFDAKTKQLLVD